MNLKNIFKSFIIGTLLLSAGGCHDEIFDADGRWNGTIPDEIDLNIVVPDPQVVNIGSTRASDVTITSLNVLLYRENGSLIENLPFASGEFTYSPTTNIGTVKIPLTADTRSIEVVANAATEIDGKSKASDVAITDNTKMYLWGRQPISSAIQTGTIPLLRNTAKIEVKLGSGVNNFEVQEVGVFGVADKGTLGPLTTAAYYDAATGLTKLPSPVAGVTYPYDGEMEDWNPTNGVHTIAGLFETPDEITHDGKKDQVRVIIKGKYTDANNASIDGYYVVQLAKRDIAGEGFSETEGHYTYGDVLNILRNYRYVITIDEVRAAGWPKLEQAKTARPDNRLTSLVTDVAPNITDIEATRDYYLGVGSDVSVYYNANAEVEITTNYPGLEAGATWAQKLELESDEDWIITNDDESAEKHVTFEERDGVVVAIVPLTQNTDSRSREGNLTVRAGKLSRKVNITQEGCPYNRRRLVTVTGIPGLDVSKYGGYYSFMDGIKYDADGNPTGEIVDNHIIGLSKEANRNVDRNGLHFPIVPLYTGVKYFIPKKEADTEAKITRGSDVFQVSEEGDNWVVTLVNEDAIKRGEGRLSISSSLEGTPVTVEYPLFRTGIFHELKSSYAGLQAEESVREGWYYYEVVRSGNVYILDRDLGAASNKGYAPGAVDYKKNTDAIGGFFKVNTSNWVLDKNDDTKRLRQDRETITAALGLHNAAKGCFLPATETDLLSLDLNCGGVVSANAVNSSIAEGKIYFPKAGYYEGSDHKDMNRCKIWTRTYLGGTQGMSITSNEYGYWYRYFDDGKSTNNENRFSNIRMARGSNGLEPTDASVWRYMPLRLVWVDKDFNNPSGSSVEEEEQVVRGKMVIYFEDTQNWSTVKYHAWNVATGGTTWGWNNLPTLTPVATKEGSKLYRVEVVPNSNAGILFKYADGDANYQTQDYTNLKSLYDNGKTVIWLTQNGKDGDKYKVKLVDSGNVESLVTSNFGGGGGDDPTPTITYTYGLKLGGETVSLTNNVLTDKVLTNASTTIEVIEYAKTGSNTTTTYYNNKFNAPGLDKDVNFTTGSSSWSLDAGTYTFTLNPTAKTLKVVKKTTPVVTDDYRYRLHGACFGNGTWTTVKMTAPSGGSTLWKLENVTVSEGSFGIKELTKTEDENNTINDNNRWYCWKGTEFTITGNGEYQATYDDKSGGFNNFKIAAGTYNFIFDSSTKKLKIEKLTTKTKFATGDKIRIKWTNNASGVWVGYTDSDFVDGADWNGSDYKTQNGSGFKFRDMTMAKECESLVFKLKSSSGNNQTLKYSENANKYDSSFGGYVIELDNNGNIK